MTTPIFDTHLAVIQLTEGGFEEKQAEALVSTVATVLGGSVATKADLANVETSLRADMAGLESRMAQMETSLRADMAGLESRMVQMETSLRADMTRMETGLRTDMTKMESGLREDIGNLRSSLNWQMLVVGLTIIGLTVTLIKLIP